MQVHWGGWHIAWANESEDSSFFFDLKHLTWPLWCHLCWPACPPYSPSWRRRPGWSLRTPPRGEDKEDTQPDCLIVSLKFVINLYMRGWSYRHTLTWHITDRKKEIKVTDEWFFLDICTTEKKRKETEFVRGGKLSYSHSVASRTVRVLWKAVARLPNDFVKLSEQLKRRGESRLLGTGFPDGQGPGRDNSISLLMTVMALEKSIDINASD